MRQVLVLVLLSAAVCKQSGRRGAVEPAAVAASAKAQTEKPCPQPSCQVERHGRRPRPEATGPSVKATAHRGNLYPLQRVARYSDIEADIDPKHRAGCGAQNTQSFFPPEGAAPCRGGRAQYPAHGGSQAAPTKARKSQIQDSAQKCLNPRI